jgi:hypothetical protein
MMQPTLWPGWTACSETSDVRVDRSTALDMTAHVACNACEPTGMYTWAQPGWHVQRDEVLAWQALSLPGGSFNQLPAGLMASDHMDALHQYGSARQLREVFSGAAATMCCSDA